MAHFAYLFIERASYVRKSCGVKNCSFFADNKQLGYSFLTDYTEIKNAHNFNFAPKFLQKVGFP